MYCSQVAQGNEFHPAVPILDAAAPKKERRQERVCLKFICNV